MKYIILTICLVLLAGCTNQNLGLSISEKIDAEKLSISEYQDSFKIENGKYKHIKKYEKDGIKYSVNEFVSPSGEVGYNKIIDDGKYIESIGYGLDAKANTFKIIKPDDFDEH